MAPSDVIACSPEEHRRGLVSLWNMLRFCASDFCMASGIIGQLYAQVSSGVSPTDSSWGLLAGELGVLERTCEGMGLPSTLAQIKRIKPIFMEGSSRIDIASFARDVMEVHTRLIDELRSRMFLVIPPERVSYYEKFQFGSDVERAFPSAGYDAIEAGKCYACNRSTACVFHLMRVLEVGLRAFADRFGVVSDHTNWHKVIEEIEKAIRAMANDPNHTAHWREQQEFFSQAASYFMVLKNAWRNYTAHARGKYTEEEAEVIFVNVRAFMQKLSARLNEGRDPPSQSAPQVQ